MKVKINERLICVSPYISTTWDQVTFLQAQKEERGEKMTLILHLADGKIVAIPHLDSTLIDLAFAAHTQHMERTASVKGGGLFPSGFKEEEITVFPLRFGIGANLSTGEGMEAAFQHNSAQANAPSLPKEVCEKIAAIARILSNGDLANFPKAEPHCNCFHCQVARSIHNDKAGQETAEESVSDTDLCFRTWDITEAGEQLYNVTNPLDSREQYRVYLGTPLGCTCGEHKCEHIRAVLAHDD